MQLRQGGSGGIDDSERANAGIRQILGTRHCDFWIYVNINNFFIIIGTIIIFEGGYF